MDIHTFLDFDYIDVSLIKVDPFKYFIPKSSE